MGKMMNDETPMAYRVGANIEGRTEVGERIRAGDPLLSRVFRGSWIKRIVFAIVEHDFEEAIATLRKVFLAHIGCVGPIMNAFDISIDEWRITVLAIALVRRRKIYAGRIFGFVFVKDDVAFIVVGCFYKLFENP